MDSLRLLHGYLSKCENEKETTGASYVTEFVTKSPRHGWSESTSASKYCAEVSTSNKRLRISSNYSA